MLDLRTLSVATLACAVGFMITMWLMRRLIDGKTYGVGAKRTLRERYKQFIKTALTSKIDVSIEITIGLDLNLQKAKTIVAHGTYIFVSDEIFQTRDFLKNIDKVYSVKDLNLKTLKKLG